MKSFQNRLFQIVGLILLTIIFIPGSDVFAENDDGSEPYTGDVLCLPDVYLQSSTDCLPLGPSEIITSMASQGIVYPLRPVTGATPNADNNLLNIEYAKINVFPPDRAPLYTSLDDASQGGSPYRYLDPGEIIYVSYDYRSDVNGNAYIYTKSGAWMRASPTTFTTFQGLEFQDNPITSVGWIVSETKPRVSPGFNAVELNETFYRETVVPVYDIQEIDGYKWYMIGINQWVDRRNIRVLNVNTDTPQGIPTDRWIEINLYEQTLAIYENNELVFGTLAATGVDPYFTQPGVFQIYEKKDTETMSGAFAADRSDYYYLEDVPWTMYYDQKRAIHGAYWRTLFGFEQSHGCVNLSVGDARYAFDWAQVGDWVYVWDPSGETPTDPAFYTAGGA
ncbi:MAG: L,D-transpeptidase [Anaerolineaceae bacterium]|nr:L,D-transpeptidase [Anaerolineaceae bacterium]